MDPKRKEFIDNRLQEHLKVQPEFRILVTRLLQIGGEAVVPRDEIFIEFMADMGRTFDAKTVKLKRGGRSDCHRNTARLLLDGKAAAVVTGWALSDDGLWRQHSWALDKNRRIIETTELRTAYFGLEFAGKPAEIWSEGQMRD